MPGTSPFLYIHIRKTAGISLRGLLANQFPHSRVLIDAHSVSGPPEPGNALFVTGHVGFDYASLFSSQPTVFTVLRDPIALALSAYYFYRSNDGHFFRLIEKDLTPEAYESRRRFTERAQRLEMVEFLADEELLGRRWLSNVQTRQLAGFRTDLVDDHPQLLDHAVAHINRCDVVGLVERLPETLKQLKQLIGVPQLGPLQHKNKTRDRPKASQADPKAIEILVSWNLMDIHLYNEASRLFEEKMNELKSRTAPEDTFDPASLPDSCNFTPDMPIIGYGWHEREQHDGKWLCWNSATTATLYLLQSRQRPSKFRCLLSHCIRQEALNQLRLELNSTPLSLEKRRSDGGCLLEGPIPAETFACDPRIAKLTIYCPVMARPCDINQTADDRSLGIAVGWIRIE